MALVAVLNERLEDFLAPPRRDCRAVVAEGDRDAVRVRHERNPDVGLGIFHRIVQQVVQNLHKSRLIDPYLRMRARMLKTYRDVLRPHGLLKVELEEIKFLHDIDLPVFQHPAVLLNPHEVKQFLHETVEVVGIVPDDGEVVAQPGVKVSGGHDVLERGADEGQRSLDFMDNVVEERNLLVEKFLLPRYAFFLP